MSYVDAGYVVALLGLSGYAVSLLLRERAVSRRLRPGEGKVREIGASAGAETPAPADRSP